MKIKDEISSLHFKYSINSALTPEQYAHLENEFIAIINTALRENSKIEGTIHKTVMEWLEKTLGHASPSEKTLSKACFSFLYLKYLNSGGFTSEKYEELETAFIDVLKKALRYNGKEKQSIENTARKLSLLFHPDKEHDELIIQWLEKTLGNYSSNEKLFSKAVCFNIFSNCKYEQLNKPTPLSYTELFEKMYSNFSIQTLKDFCEAQKETASNKMQAQFYTDCIEMLGNVIKYHKNVDFSQCKIPATWAHKILPVTITSTIGVVFAQELCVFYGICFIYNRLGHSMKQSTTLPVRLFGTAMEASSENAILSAAIGFVKIHTQVTAMCNSSHKRIVQEFDYIQQFVKKLLPYSEKKNILALTQYQFQSPCLEEVITPLKNYLITTDKQSFKKVRCGQQKSDAVKKFFYNLIILEANRILRPREIWSLLENLARTDVILNNSGTIQTALLDTKDRFFHLYRSAIKQDEQEANPQISMS